MNEVGKQWRILSIGVKGYWLNFNRIVLAVENTLKTDGKGQSRETVRGS